MINFFHTLRGKLIVTYVTVTVLALLALEVVVLGIVLIFSQGLDTNLNSYLFDVEAVLAPQARIYLKPGEIDLPGLQDWLNSIYEGGYASLPASGLFDSPAASIVKSEPMYVLASDGTVIAAAPEQAASLIGRRYTSPADIDGVEQVFANAMQVDLLPTDISMLTPDGTYFMAVPISQELGSSTLAGVIIVTVGAPNSGLNKQWSQLLAIVPITGLVLLLMVVPFGALFGFIMSRGLTRRLTALSAAADAWSEGDFSVRPNDTSKDEISTLGMRLRRMAEHVQALLQSRKELTLMEERNRLARELHDTVKQETFATLMQVRAAKNLLERDPLAARRHLDEAEELIKTSQQELGLLISELRPAALEGQGLAGALNDFLDNWSQHSRIPYHLQVQNEQRVPLEVEETFYRVAQEALSNVARHSRASAVEVQLAFEPGKATLLVSDNGVGFDSHADGNGFGLRSMRDRMLKVNGSLDVQSCQENGTRVTASAPTLPREEH